eukprot:TRINITY_DN734_c0_g1_i4.p1 TRINITY_DN734_c0_g1~~TRINITY_DN734_c0_g1_i4.p1  ORF type:complete len:433 (+),score=45.88 TRINITY_DN734_c0_g1_i4:432-1730(+)
MKTLSDEDRQMILNLAPQLIYRPKVDTFGVQYGDGGYVNLLYPIWVCDSLPISKKFRSNLVQNLELLGSRKRDIHVNEPVEDYIDPDFAPFIRTNMKPWFEEELDYLKFFLSRLRSNKNGQIERRIRSLQYKIARKVPSKKDSLRGRLGYHWIPSEFLVQPNGRVKIMSQIHGVPMESKFKPLYISITKVFQEMVPMFDKLGIIKKDTETKLQVVVKAQTYHIEPGMSYSGKWHLEGVTERIVAVGVYYCHVDSDLEGGNLKFRPRKIPQRHYCSHEKDYFDCEINVNEGVAVVFSNTIPHRFKKITNRTLFPLKRTILNFFIVDPGLPLVSTAQLPPLQSVETALRESFLNLIHEHLPDNIIRLILSFLPGYWESEEKAFEFREQSRELMKQNKSGWGWINWGNTGDVVFVEPLITESDDEIRNIELTDSC